MFIRHYIDSNATTTVGCLLHSLMPFPAFRGIEVYAHELSQEKILVTMKQKMQFEKSQTETSKKRSKYAGAKIKNWQRKSKREKANKLVNEIKNRGMGDKTQNT